MQTPIWGLSCSCSFWPHGRALLNHVSSFERTMQNHMLLLKCQWKVDRWHEDLQAVVLRSVFCYQQVSGAECRGAGGDCRDGRRGKSGRENGYGPRRGRWQGALPGERSFCLVILGVEGKGKAVTERGKRLQRKEFIFLGEGKGLQERT